MSTEIRNRREAMSRIIAWIIAGAMAYIAIPILAIVAILSIWWWCTAYIANGLIKDFIEDEEKK